VLPDSSVTRKRVPRGAEVPRSEYPRPQFVRQSVSDAGAETTEWLNLNGYWEFRFDDANVGMEQRWYTETGRFPLRILVPFSFESRMSGIGDRSFHPCVWYRREFEVPERWAGRRVLLHLDAVDYRATVWVNGAVVAMHEGGHTPFSCDITGALAGAANTVTVRAEDPPADRYIPRGKQYWEEKPVSIFYARTTGIWQTVWLEPVPRSYLERVRITPETDGSVAFEARVAEPEPFQHVEVSIRRDGQVISSGMSVADGPRANIAASVSNPELWSPDRPVLYDVRFELHGKHGLADRVDAYFGFRSIATQDGKVLLNGDPLYLKTVLDQGYWPESNLTPPSDEAIQADIRATKEMGFNGVRKHQKVEDPRYLYQADRLGLLVCGEMANAYLFNEESVARMTREWVEVVNRDYNHPCIVIWVPVNESWGVPNLSNARQQAHLRALYYLTKSLDATRLVIDNDGWEHTEATDLFAIHDYVQSGEEFLRRYREIGTNGVPLPVIGKMYLAPGNRYNGSPIFLSEFGGVGFVLPEDRAKVPENSWGYSGFAPTAEFALERMKELYEGIARVPRIAGVCYTQLYDVEQEVNGLLTYDRRPKFDFRTIRQINALLR
jgi:beta-galactosidase/beta-glucuronidase